MQSKQLLKIPDDSQQLLREVAAAAARVRCPIAGEAAAAARREQAELLDSVYEQLDQVRGDLHGNLDRLAYQWMPSPGRREHAAPPAVRRRKRAAAGLAAPRWPRTPPTPHTLTAFPDLPPAPCRRSSSPRAAGSSPRASATSLTRSARAPPLMVGPLGGGAPCMIAWKRGARRVPAHARPAVGHWGSALQA